MQTLKLTKKYQTYPEYKDSGVESLGKIPKNWEIKKLKHLARFQYGGSLPDDTRKDGDIQVFGSNGPVGSHDEANTLSPVIVVGRKGSYGVVNYSQENVFAIDTTYYIDARHTSENIKWLYYTLGILGLNLFSQDTGVPGLSRASAYEKLVPVPNSKEQTELVSYLDEKISSIDQIIEKKEKLIELLREKRIAVINCAVTKGLDSKSKLINSDVDWIGNIPRGWEIRKLKSGFDFEKGKEAGKFTQEFVGDEKNKGEYPVYSGQTENNGVLGEINTYKYNFPKGVLFSTTVGAKAMTTKFLVGEFSLSQNCVLMIPNKKADSAYFNYLLEVGFKRMRDNIPSHIQPSLRVSDLNKFIVLFPPVEHQKEIAEYLDTKCGYFEKAINKAEFTIEFLKEFKSSLISNVVTGKIKV